MPEKLKGMLAALAIYHPNSTPILRTAILAALAQREAETVERCACVADGAFVEKYEERVIAEAIAFSIRALASPATEGKP